MRIKTRAYISDDTPNHRIGEIMEEFIFKKYKKEGLEVYRQDSNHKLPKKFKKFLDSKENIKELERNHSDFFWKNNDEINVIEVKSKKVPQKERKDERRFDTSQKQLDTLNFCKHNGIKVRVHIIWYTEENTCHDRCFDFEEFSITGGYIYLNPSPERKKRFKLTLSNSLIYSPERVKYEPLPFKIQDYI